MEYLGKSSNNKDLVPKEYVDALLAQKANMYVATFSTSDWTSQSITVSASTHGCGATPMVEVQVLNGTSYESYYGYPSNGWKVSLDSSGNITVSVSDSGFEFAGRIVVR